MLWISSGPRRLLNDTLTSDCADALNAPAQARPSQSLGSMDGDNALTVRPAQPINTALAKAPGFRQTAQKSEMVGNRFVRRLNV
jgi:hypothetical protein